ncbi:MAG TPA: hypothetical protein VMV69_18450 [Pirellulales bacterium]|nr:hypothetical protein [Pirellulales bacterium]
MRGHSAHKRIVGFSWAIRAGVLAAILSLVGAPAPAQETGADDASDTAKKSSAQAAAELTLAQERVEKKYKEFEKVLARMVELTASTDPKRAALLRKAVARSKERLIGAQFEKLIDLLKQDRLANAVGNQRAVELDLNALLQLLLSEQRGQRLKDERQRIKEQIRRINELINREQEIQNRTANGADAKRLAEGQGKVAQEAKKLAQAMRDDAGSAEPIDAPKGDQSDPADEKTDHERKPSDRGGEQTPSPKPKDEKGQQGQKGRQGQPDSDDQPQDQDQNQDQDQPQDLARKRVEAAQQKMEQARLKLEKAQREGAIPDQEQAIRELEKAKAELEEILRQLREEEVERTLAMLEARFRRMLQAQIEVYEGTRRLDRVAASDRGRNDEIEAGRLSRKEASIVTDVEIAQTLLRDEGSAVAFAEAVSQMREDMRQVVDWLAQAKVDETCQGVEQDVIAALEEMIEALRKAQKDQERKKQRQQQGEPQDPPLIDAIAELKMIRALQMRVNTRTKRYNKLVEGDDLGQADKPELIQALERLAERESRIFRATRDIVTGKNQ